MSDDQGKIRITWDDVNKAEVDPPTPVAIPVTRPVRPSGDGSWGTISPQPNAAASMTTSGGSVLLKGWFYLGAAGLVGAFLAWMFCEPSFEDVGVQGWGSAFMFPLMVILMSIGFGSAESVVERTWKRAFLRGLASTGLGLVLGFFFYGIANIVFAILTGLLVNLGADEDGLPSNPLFWLVRALAWAVFGMAGGLIFGIVSKSGKKTSYGMLGGVIGAAIGGILFDPISLMAGGAEASRVIGMSILGASTGIAIGLVESALKDRWLYVSGGPLAGKQFVLYQDLVTIGRSQSNTIYLFKDPEILEQHATIEHRAGKSLITACGPVVVSGQPLQSRMQRALSNGDSIQIGRYTFKYAEKERAAKP
ncbi:MAG: FHA domain-containing protein [Verrucomicrobia bacterium]|nr:FHA domain-containing protein [Verrucomicrobiota bacterium]